MKIDAERLERLAAAIRRDEIANQVLEQMHAATESWLANHAGHLEAVRAIAITADVEEWWGEKVRPIRILECQVCRRPFVFAVRFAAEDQAEGGNDRSHVGTEVN